MNQPRTTGSTTDKEMVTMAEEELARLHRQVNKYKVKGGGGTKKQTILNAAYLYISSY